MAEFLERSLSSLLTCYLCSHLSCHHPQTSHLKAWYCYTTVQKSSSYGLWADGQWVMMAKAFRPCGKARPGFESVLLLMPPVKGVQTRYTHTSTPENENIRLLTKNLKRIAWSKVVRTPSSAPAVTDLQRAVVNTACPSTPPVRLNLLI